MPCDSPFLPRDLIVRLSWLGHDHSAAIGELDINPLVLYGQGEGARVVDALVVLRTVDAGAKHA